MEEEKKIAWWKRWEIWGTILQCLSGILSVAFPDIVVLVRIGSVLGLIAGTLMQMRGLIAGYQANNLPDFISAGLDKVSVKYVGIRGSAIEEEITE